MGMIDISEKPAVLRTAEAAGTIELSTSTVERMVQGDIQKGDPMAVAEVAAMTAAKQTHLLIPHCHQIPLNTVQVRFQVRDAAVEVRCLVRAHAKTGVEMEALVGVSAALHTIFDMVKYLEKDGSGQYPHTRITDIRVVDKQKRAVSTV